MIGALERSWLLQRASFGAKILKCLTVENPHRTFGGEGWGKKARCGVKHQYCILIAAQQQVHTARCFKY